MLGLPDDRYVRLDGTILEMAGPVVYDVLAVEALRLTRRLRLETPELMRLIVLCGTLSGTLIRLILYALGVRV